MSDISVRVRSPLKTSEYSLTIDREDVFGSIKQYLLALSPLLQPVTAFDLAHNGTCVAGETAIFAVVDESVKEIQLDMVLASHTFKDVELQLEHVREALALTPPESTYLNAGPKRISDVRPGSKKTKKMAEDDLLSIAEAAAADHDMDVLVAYPNDDVPKPAARELQLSKWQSVAQDPRLRMQGVLAFIKFRSNDGKIWHFVATTKGFTSVSQLTDDVFALPGKGASYAPSLFQLIEQTSPATATLARKIAERTKADPLACVAVPQVVSTAPWLVDRVPALGSGYCGTTLAQTSNNTPPEHNEDFQTAREMKAESITDRIARDRRLHHIAVEFAAAAMEIGTRIVEGGVKPLNPDEEPESARVYLSDGIFFTYGADFAQAYADLGGDVAARQAAKKDLRGVEQLMLLDEPDLCPVLTSVIDYMGRRLVAQAPVPGIFRETEDPMIVYGRSENKEEVYHDEKVNGLMARLAERLHLKPHPVNRDGIELQTSADVHGTRATDGRIYAIDLARLQVPDLLTTSEGLNLLRVEAVARYYITKREKGEPEVSLNPDVWMSKQDIPESYAAEFDNDVAAAKDVARFVREEIAPSLVNNIADGTGIDPVDGQHLTTLMHRSGINMRLLGLVSRLAVDVGLQSLAEVALEEAIARSLKHMINVLIHDIPIVDAKSTIEDFVRKFQAADADVVASVRSQLESHFGFTNLKDDWASTHFSRLSLLRLVSFKLGLQWNRDWSLAAINPVIRFAAPRSLLADEALEAGRQSLEVAAQAQLRAESPDEEAKSADIEGASTKQESEEKPERPAEIKNQEEDSPQKSTTPESTLSAKEIDDSFSEGFTLINEAASIYSQIYGAAHSETARVLNHIALMFFEYGSDVTKAVEFGRRAITVAERVEGLDSHEVLVMYGNLAYFERAAGHLATSLQLLERVLALLNELSWPGYSNLYTTLSSVATMLQQSGKPKLQKASLQWFERAIKAAEMTPKGVRGTLWFEYAQSQLVNQDLKGAVRSMELSHNVFKSTLGPEDDNTKETKKYLEQLLQLTVHSAQSRSAAAAQVSRQQQEQRAASEASKSRKSKKSKSTVPRLGERNLNDVLEYIMGDSSTSKSIKKGTK